MKEDKPRFGFMSRNYLVLTLTSTLWGIPTSICNTYFSLYVLGLNGTEVIIGLVTALGSASFVIVAIIGGHMADLYGRKKLVGKMTLVLGLSQFLIAFAPNWQILSIVVVVSNVFWVFEPAFWAMLADSISEQKRGTAYSLFSCLNFLPWAIMPSIGGYLIDTQGILPVMRLAYIGLAVSGIISGILRLSLLQETISSKPKENDSQHNFQKVSKLIKDSFREHLQAWRWMPRSALALTASYILWAFEYGLVEPYWIVYAQEEIHLSSTEWGIVIAVGSAISIVSKTLLVGRMLDKFGRRKVLLATTASDVFTYLLFIRCGMFAQVIILWTVSSFIWSFYDPTYSALEADLIPKERRGRVFAVFGIAWNTFVIPASLLGGFIYEQVSQQLSFIMASVGVIVCFALTAVFIKKSHSL